MPQNRPNILFILSDQQRWDTVGAYGQNQAATPTLDRLAAEGVLFENAFTCQPVCGPARSCLQTGKFATQTGCLVNGRALPESETTVAHRLRRAGYDVAYVGKWHLASTAGTDHVYHYSPVPRRRRGGYDGYWVAADLPEFVSNGYEGVLYDRDDVPAPWKGYRADAYTDFAIDYLEQRPADRPFFLFLSYVEPHPQPYHSRYRGPEPHSRSGIIRDYLRYDAPVDAVRRADVCRVPRDLIDTPGDWQQGYGDYLACCERIDANLSRLLGYLEARAALDDTVVVFTSDHGSHFHTRHKRDDKCSCHDSSIRVPLIMHGPGFEDGRKVEDLVSLIDLPPTLMECAGLPVPTEMMGRPVQETLRPRSAAWPESVYVQISNAETGRAIRTRDWKYAVTAADSRQPLAGKADEYVESHLYDLNRDPYELNNLASDPRYHGIRMELRKELLAWMVKAGEGRPRSVL